MDGAIIVSADGTVEAACRYLDCSAADVTLSKGLGGPALGRRRHQPGHQRRGRHGQPEQRHGPHLPERRDRAPHRALSRRPMVWKGFEYESPAEAKRQPAPDGKKRTSDRHPIPSGGRRIRWSRRRLRDLGRRSAAYPPAAPAPTARRYRRRGSFALMIGAERICTELAGLPSNSPIRRPSGRGCWSAAAPGDSGRRAAPGGSAHYPRPRERRSAAPAAGG